MITKETIKEHVLTAPDECETHNQNQEKNLSKGKEKSKLNKKH